MAMAADQGTRAGRIKSHLIIPHRLTEGEHQGSSANDADHAAGDQSA